MFYSRGGGKVARFVKIFFIFFLLMLFLSCKLSDPDNDENEPAQEEPGRFVWVTGENTLKYESPDLYLKNGIQSTLKDNYFQAIDALLDITGKTLYDIVKIFRWKQGTFIPYQGGGDLIGISTADTIYEVKRLSGCHDHGLIMASVLRRYGFPVILIDSADVQWAKDFHDGTATGYLGHVFLEVYVNGGWILLDSTSGDYALDYNHDLLSLHYDGETKEYYVLLKGLDTNDCEVYAKSDLYQTHMAEFANQVYDLSWTKSNYADKNLKYYENDQNRSCTAANTINLTVNFNYTGANTVDANHRIMVQLDKYSTGTMLTLRKSTTASGSITITDSKKVVYVFMRIGMDKDGNGRFSTGDPMKIYTDIFNNKVGIPILSAITVNISFDDSDPYGTSLDTPLP